MFFKAEDAIILTYCKDDNTEKQLKIKAEAGSYGSPMLRVARVELNTALIKQAKSAIAKSLDINNT